MIELTPRDRLILALDAPEHEAAKRLAEATQSSVGVFKIGLTLIAGGGLTLAASLKRLGQVFLDFKLYDIPAQVEGAAKACADMGADFLTVHAQAKVVEAAVRGAAGSDLKILGVTVLTAFDQSDLDRDGHAHSVADLVAIRARSAIDAGAHGLVASPLEAAAIRAIAPTDFEIVTPGVRPTGASMDDQKRIATPDAALRAGASRLVVGRPITAADDPTRAAADIHDLIAAAR